MTPNEIRLAVALNARIRDAAEAIASIDDDHESGEELTQTWEYDEDHDTFSLELLSTSEYNDSCHCHPEWRTKHHTTRHTIPGREIADGIEDYLDDSYDAWEYRFQPSFQAQETAYKERKAAEKREREAKAEAEVRRQRLNRENDERRQLAALQAKYGEAK